MTAPTPAPDVPTAGATVTEGAWDLLASPFPPALAQCPPTGTSAERRGRNQAGRWLERSVGLPRRHFQPARAVVHHCRHSLDQREHPGRPSEMWLSYWTRSFKLRGQPCATGEVSTRPRVPIGHLGPEPIVAQCAPPLPPSTLRRSVSSAPQTGSCK